MPDLSASLTTIRTSGYETRGYLSYWTETSVLGGTIAAPITEPLLTLTYATTSGSSANVERDMEILYTDSAGTFKGRGRVALSGTISSTSLPVNEVSQGRVQIVVGDKFTVVRSWRVRDRLVGASKTFPKDSRLEYSAASDPGDNPPPVCNSGGGWAGFVDSGQTYATVVMAGSLSYTVDPDSAGTVTHVWTLPTGVAFAPGSVSTDANPTLRVNTGSYWVKHVVTDSTNSISETQFVPMRCHDTSTDTPLPILMESCDADRLSGVWRATFRTRGTTTISALPDGAMICYWERETYAGTVQSFGNSVTNRSHIKFMGFLLSDTIAVDYANNEVTFEAVNVIGLLTQLPGFSQVMTNDSTASNWTEIKTLTVKRAIIYLMRYSTTAMRLFDFTYDMVDQGYPELFVQQDTPGGQITELCNAVDGVLTATRLGQMACKYRLELASTTIRTAATTTLSLTTTDLIDINLRREHRWRVNTVEARGFFSTSTKATPLMSLAPGAAPAEAAGETVIERLIVAGQSDINTRAGYRLAYENGTTTSLPAVRGDITLRGSYDVFDIGYAEWLKLTLASTTNRRGVSFSAARFIIEQISLSYDVARGGKVVRLTVQEETTGVAGTTKIVPFDTQTNLGNFTLPSLEFVTTFPQPEITTGAGRITAGLNNICLIMSNGHLHRSANFNDAVPTWDDVDLSASISSPQQWVLDANPANTTVNGWLITGTGGGVNDGIFYITDIFGATPTLTFQYEQSAGAPNIDASYGAGGAGKFVIACVRPTGAVNTFNTFDSGTTWNTGGSTSGTISTLPGLFFNSRDGSIYMGSPSVLGGTGQFTIWKSTDYGATFFEIGRTATYAASADEAVASIYLPFADVTGTRLFHGYYNNGANNARLYRWIVGGGAAAWEDISYSDGVEKYTPTWSGRYTIAMPGNSTEYLAYAGWAPNYTPDKYGVFITANASTGSPTTWTVVEAAASTVEYRRVALTDTIALYAFGINGSIAYTDTPFTVGLADKRGALVTAGTVLGIAGGSA